MTATFHLPLFQHRLASGIRVQDAAIGVSTGNPVLLYRPRFCSTDIDNFAALIRCATTASALLGWTVLSRVP